MLSNPLFLSTLLSSIQQNQNEASIESNDESETNVKQEPIDPIDSNSTLEESTAAKEPSLLEKELMKTGGIYVLKYQKIF
jgi:hypothetical protein